MIKNDLWIREQAAKGMISPFEPSLIRQVYDRKVISFGTSSYGYDIRLSPKEFFVFRRRPGVIVDPKSFSPENLERVELQHSLSGDFFIVPGNSYGLGVAIERLQMPPNVTAICLGKSTYARCFTGETKVKLIDGDYTFIELMEKAEKGERLFGFGVLNGESVVQELVNPRFIEESEIVRVYLDDNSFVDCTPDHKFLSRRGDWIEAQHLTPGLSLRAIYQHQSHGYPTIYDSVKADNSEYRADGWTELHHLVWDCLARNGEVESRPKGWHVHHKDENKGNPLPLNLELISPSKHAELHNQQNVRYMAGGIKFRELFEESEEFRLRICESLHSDESKEKSREALKCWRKSDENKQRLSDARASRWLDDNQRIKQSQVAHKGIGALNRRDDVNHETLTQALLKAGTIRGASKLLQVDRSAFRRFPDVIKQFKAGELQVNHKVVGIERLKTIQPTYCLTAPETGNFALSSGVFVQNCGLIANVTPAEASWNGNLTLEFSNSSEADCRVYANEGICQLLFLEGEPCETTYADRKGKYQDQGEEVTLARV